MIKEYAKQVAEKLASFFERGAVYVVDIAGDEIYDTYLKVLGSEGVDTVFRDPNSTDHTCRTCSGIIRRYGKIVSINPDSGKLESIFDTENTPDDYKAVAAVLSELVTSKPIMDVFIENVDGARKMQGYSYNATTELHRIGVEKNTKRYTKEEAEMYGVVKPNETRQFHHFYVDIPNGYVSTGSDSKKAWFRDKRNVYARALKEIGVETLNLVEDLIAQGSLLDGDSHLHAVQAFKKEASLYAMCKDSETIENWFWTITYDMSERDAKFRNTLIGVLCAEISEGMELEKACKNWNKRVDPANYHKATAPITQKQIEEAKKFVQENDYEPAFNRRFVTIDDIKASEIKFMDAGDGEIKEVSIFDNVKSSKTPITLKNTDKLKEVSIEDFLENIVPQSTGIQVYLDNKHQDNLVTMTKGNDEAKNIFKWDNNYSWTFNGNLAGKSQIKQAVKTAGGAVDGVLRFSIMWAKENGDNSDLDAHCRTSKGHHIYFSSKNDIGTSGVLDIDITKPKNQMPHGAVENITFPLQERINGKSFRFFVNQFSPRNSQGFEAEIEYNGEIHHYVYDKSVQSDVDVCTVHIGKNGEVEFDHKLESSSSSRQVWGVETKKFHDVKLVCTSPNHWGNNNLGNKHYMFMIDGCKPEGKIRSFHNENLNDELTKHRKVMEVLGASSMLEAQETALSGLGFNSTVKDSVVVKVEGSKTQMIKVNF